MLLRQPYVFDIIISDFGRESTVEFLRSVAILEKRVIHTKLTEPNTKFYDEYRRIMFVLVGDLAYFKQSMLARYADVGHLDSSVLVGIGEPSVPEEVKRRIGDSVVEQIYLALLHGYSSVRVIIPCNTLTPLGDSISELLGNPTDLVSAIGRRLELKKDAMDQLIERLRSAALSLYTIPGIVLDEVRAVNGVEGSLLVLGTPSAVQVYYTELVRLGSDMRYAILELTSGEQSLVNDAVVASIDGDASRVRQLRQRIERELVAPRRVTADRLVVVEACTDFDLALGLNSRDILVERLVRDAYGLQRSDVPWS